jgi:hypothetical protein
MSAPVSWFDRRTAVIATMHHKEQAIAPLLHSIGIQSLVPSDFNTDRFGTFTRDIDRTGDQRTAARLKAQLALDMTGETLAIASEGSFGPHPAFPFIPCDRELVLLLDQAHDLELVGQVLSTETNYSQQVITQIAEAEAFAAKAKFPSHGLVVIASPEPIAEPQQIIKGIVTEAQLQEALSWAFAQSPRVSIETDMRALYNPTRMTVIAQATQNLIQIMNQVCPDCGCPGFQIVSQTSGLRCGLCHSPTDLIRSVLYQCPKCDRQQETLFPNGETADPGQCAYCNP